MGASREGGCWLGVAKHFADRGAIVIVCSRNRTSAPKSTNLIRCRAYPERLDVTDLCTWSEFVQRMPEAHARIDMLVSSAGYPSVCNMWNKGFHEITEEEKFDKVIEIDLTATLRLSEAVISYMLRNGRTALRVIINIASILAIPGQTAGAPCRVAKSRVITLTKHIALEYSDKNFRVLYSHSLGNISPEATFATMSQSERKKTAIENSMKRRADLGDPTEIVTIAANVSAKLFAFVTGKTLGIDGGAVTQ